MSDWLEIGKIVAAHGLRGEVRIYPDSDFPERFQQPGPRWLLRPGASEPEEIELLKGRFLDGKGLYIIQLEGVTNRDQAEALRGAVLMVPEGDRLPLEEDEFHVSDLIGLDVFDQHSQTVIGVVTAVIAAGNDLLEVERHAPAIATDTPETVEVPSENPSKSRRKRNAPSTKVLIPFVEEIVPIVDLEQGRLEINPPAGLL